MTTSSILTALATVTAVALVGCTDDDTMVERQESGFASQSLFQGEIAECLADSTQQRCEPLCWDLFELPDEASIESCKITSHELAGANVTVKYLIPIDPDAPAGGGAGGSVGGDDGDGGDDGGDGGYNGDDGGDGGDDGDTGSDDGSEGSDDGGDDGNTSGDDGDDGGDDGGGDDGGDDGGDSIKHHHATHAHVHAARKAAEQPNPVVPS